MHKKQNPTQQNNQKFINPAPTYNRMHKNEKLLATYRSTFAYPTAHSSTNKS